MLSSDTLQSSGVGRNIFILFRVIKWSYHIGCDKVILSNGIFLNQYAQLNN